MRREYRRVDAACSPTEPGDAAASRKDACPASARRRSRRCCLCGFINRRMRLSFVSGA